MPDLDILIEMADYYNVEIREILDDERKDEKMNKELEDTVLKVADYSNEERKRLIKRIHVLFLVGIIAFIIYMILDIMGLTNQGITEAIASFCLGIVLGMLIAGLIYTSRYGARIREYKKRLLKRQV